MRLVTFERHGGPPEAGVLAMDDEVVPLAPALHRAGILDSPEPVSMLEVLDHWHAGADALRRAVSDAEETVPLSKVRLRPPLPRPRTFRDFYAFEDHVARSWKRRGAAVPDAWYEVPVFYFSNPDTFRASGDPIAGPRGTQALDFELECAWVVGEELRNPSPEEAAAAVMGLMILNDWSARDLQRQEMSVGLGPAKGKDFATSLGPWLVTVDELEDRRTGKAFDLRMEASVNGERVGGGNLKDIHWSLGEMTARAAADARVRPGDVLATGTVGTGSLLDIGREPGAYLQPGDEVALKIERLGTLTNTIASER